MAPGRSLTQWRLKELITASNDLPNHGNSDASPFDIMNIGEIWYGKTKVREVS